MVKYVPPTPTGLESVISENDGCSITISWHKAYPVDQSNKIAYNIYYSTEKLNVLSEGPKFVYTGDDTSITISEFSLGQLYFFNVRAIEYDPNILDLAEDLTFYSIDLKVYPESVLRNDITENSLIIPLLDVSDFPDSGTIRIGAELIQYLAKDNLNNDLHLSNVSQRGFNNTFARPHTVDGYDGYKYWSTAVRIFPSGEDTTNDKYFMSEADVDYDHYPYTEEDGYKQVVKDLLNSDLTYGEEENEDFAPYDYAGWHRVDPLKLLNGDCVGSYLMGEKGCIDEYGNYNIIRGRSLQDISNERLEVLLRLSGRPAVLLRKQHTGIICSCYGNRREYQDDRCRYCYGTKFVMGYQQYYNSRRSDSRIMVRVEPASEKVIMQEAGLESTFDISAWTLVIPIIKPRDIIVFYDNGGNEDFRYEVTDVTRNTLLGNDLGAQKFRAVRIRKTDPVYQVKIFSDTSSFPEKINTSVASSANGNIPPHTHIITVNENTTNLTQINQETSLVQGHSHPVINGQVCEVLGHSHSIILS